MAETGRLKSQSTAFVFPGQGSQALGMGSELAGQFPVAKRIFEEADDTLGFGLSQIMWNGPLEDLNDTVNTQPALFVHSMAALEVLREIHSDLRPAILAGHSLGELSALTAGGALPFAGALQLVRRRGELMKRAGEERPGSMAAVLNLDVGALEGICVSASSGEESVEVANDNCPGQVVISGAKPAVERAMELAKAAGARRTVRLPISIAAHSKLMGNIQDAWDQSVLEAGLTDSDIPLVGNVHAAVIAASADLSKDIRSQMQSRVRWAETIREARARGIETFVEIGTGTVLLGLIRRIAPDAIGRPLGGPADYAAVQ
jgi:[acyl-carrier-protein] S-malonyltransferase